jgi:hypothetical protein
MSKLCLRCNRKRKSSCFYVRSDGYGLFSYCKDCNTQRGREWIKENPQRHIQQAREYRRTHPWKSMWMRAKWVAHRRRLEFNLTEEHLQTLFVDVCPILGIRLQYGGGTGRPNSNSASVDRINSSKGYIVGNVAIISYRANCIKSDGTAAEHRRVADYMDAHQ